MNRKVILWIGGLTVLCAAAFGLGLMQTRQGGGGAPRARAAVTEPTVLNARIVEGEAGWSLTENGLSWSSDGGRTWTSIEPPELSSSSILSVYFGNSKQGRLIAAGTPDGEGHQALIAYRTEDGGRTWTSQGLPGGKRSDVGSITATFSDPEHGYVMVIQGTNASGSAEATAMYATADGGASWSELPAPPVAGYLYFSSSTRGWLVGGEGGSGFFSSSDGGRSWNPVQIQIPAGVGSKASFGLPRLSAEGSGLLPVTFNDESDHTAVGVFRTTDGGTSWSLLSLVPLQGIVGPGVDPPDTSFLGSESLVVQDPKSSALALISPVVGLSSEPNSPQLVTPSGAPHGVAPFVVPPGEKAAFSVVHSETCANKVECTTINELLVTRDSGRSWEAVHAP